MELNVVRIEVPAALDAARARALGDAVEAAGAADASVIVLVGQAGLFCRGLDFEALLSQSPAGGSPDAGVVEAGVMAFGRCLGVIRAARRPVISVVDGAALGGGVGIAAAADLLLATARSTFALPEALFGLVPAIVLPVLLERMTPHHARLLALRGRTHSAEEAHACGLVDVVVRDGPDAIDRAVQLAAREMARPRTAAIETLRPLCAELARLPLDAAFRRGAAETHRMLLAPGVSAALRAFVTDGEAPWLSE